jgi:nucleoside phosphorylase
LVADSDTYYHYGEIVGDHDTHFIVIVRPTRSGKAAMSDAASQVRLNFKNIKYSFFVGIAGALPHDAGWEDPANELQRGDVVIARAQEGHNAVLEYDYANYLAYNNIQPKWISDNTAPSLQSLSNVWFDAHREGHSRAQGILANLIQRNPAFAAPPPCEDLLFHSLEPHSGKEGDCTSCSEDYRNPRRRTDRLERGCYNIKVYRGLVVTGDSVIRNPSLRAAIKSHSWGRTALCADMESAVLMDKFHPLIIRGISDYADSHYGWKWVSYAAATAAAVAKDMITRLQPVQCTAPQEREDSAGMYVTHSTLRIHH